MVWGRNTVYNNEKEVRVSFFMKKKEEVGKGNKD